MRIIIDYENTELEAMEAMSNTINREIGIKEPTKILREKLELVSPYIGAGIAPTKHGAKIALDIRVDYIRDICGTVASNAKKFVAVGKAIVSVIEAVNAVTPGIKDLRKIVATALKLEIVEQKKAA